MLTGVCLLQKQKAVDDCTSDYAGSNNATSNNDITAKPADGIILPQKITTVHLLMTMLNYKIIFAVMLSRITH